jgi:L-fuconolactonase
MIVRADAHIHLFEGGFRESFAARDGVAIDEALCFNTLATDHDVSAALVVGYQGLDWCKDNNQFIAAARNDYTWINLVAFIELDTPLTIAALEGWQEQGFIGVSLYVADETAVTALSGISFDCWHWLNDHNWLVSVNSRGDAWNAWLPILEEVPALGLLASHLGLPPPVSEPVPETDETRLLMQSVLELAAFPGAHVKLSGYYAATRPRHDFPHRVAWPYTEALRDAFSVDRLLWGSDFSPCLDHLTYPQTYDLFRHMPFFTETDIAKITSENLLGLLAAVAQ